MWWSYNYFGHKDGVKLKICNDGAMFPLNKKKLETSFLFLQFFICRCGSVIQWGTSLCDPMDCSMTGFPAPHHLSEFAQTHVHWVGGFIQPSHPMLSPSPPAFNLSQYQGLLQGVSSSHQVTKVLELQLHHQSFQWIFRTDFFRIEWFDLLAV